MQDGCWGYSVSHAPVFLFHIKKKKELYCLEVSKRLQQVAAFVSYATMADIGTDHGYVPLYLWKMGKVTKALACDINKGPLARAKENISRMGAEQVVETRLGSGLCPIQPGEVETAVIAGMGGMLTIHILEDSKDVVESLKELVLSPQHDIDAVRKYIHKIGFSITEEAFLKEDGKYYTILRCIPGQEQYETEIEYQYGKILLEAGSSLLIEKLEQEEKQLRKVEEKLRQNPSGNAEIRLQEVTESLRQIQEAKAWQKQK